MRKLKVFWGMHWMSNLKIYYEVQKKRENFKISNYKHNTMVLNRKKDICSGVVAVPICHGEERANPKDEAFDLLVNLHPHPQLWS